MIEILGISMHWLLIGISVLINGGPSSFFTASRGLRQGDPLSSLLFIIVIESLNDLLRRANDLQLMKGVSVRRGENSTVVTHLLFADDTLIFL